jgi:aminopeptidase N
VKVSKDVEKYCLYVEEGREHRPLCSTQFSHPNDLLFDEVFQHKAPLILHMIAAKIGGDHLKSVIQAFLQTDRLLETNIFVGRFRRQAGISIKEFATSWIYGTGAPLISCDFTYNKKENILEVMIKQRPLQLSRL